MKREKKVECDGIELENGEEIGQIRQEGYKYLGILEKRDICQEEMKENISKEYWILAFISKEHVFQATNTWVVPTVWYSAGIIEWTKEEVKKMDRKTRKIIIMYGGIHLR